MLPGGRKDTGKRRISPFLSLPFLKLTSLPIRSPKPESYERVYVSLLLPSRGSIVSFISQVREAGKKK